MKSFFFIFLLITSQFFLKADSLLEERRRILLFGIDSDLKELVSLLKQERNTQFLQELKTLFEQTKDQALQDQILLYFLDLEEKGLEDNVLAVLKEPEGKSNSVLLNSISYLTAVGAQNAKEQLAFLIDDKNKILAVAAIRGLGKLKSTEYAKKLLEKLSLADAELKPDLIWSLGEMKAHEASQALLKEYEGAELSQPLLCQSLLEAFGKIGDQQFWPVIEKALSHSHVLVRAKAIACLASYPNHNSAQRLIWALRDGQAPVRQAAAEAAFVLKPIELKDILLFRIEKDPDFKVRIACLKALTMYDQGLWRQPLQLIFQNPMTAPQLWKELFRIFLEKKVQGLDTIALKLIEREKKDKKSFLLTQMALVLLAQKESVLPEVYGAILQSQTVAAKSSILRVLYIQQKKEFISDIKRLAEHDEYPEVRNLARSILKEWEPVTPAASS